MAQSSGMHRVLRVEAVDGEQLGPIDSPRKERRTEIAQRTSQLGLYEDELVRNEQEEQDRRVPFNARRTYLRRL